jgi:hypothetical protein
VNYKDGTLVRLGDRVKLLGDVFGEVACSMDTDDYSDEFTKKDWGYLKRGVMIKTKELGLVHFSEEDGELEKV